MTILVLVVYVRVSVWLLPCRVVYEFCRSVALSLNVLVFRLCRLVTVVLKVGIV